jgi:chaperonin GroEL
VEYQKAKSASKIVIPRSNELDSEILHTAKIIADIVGGTLGPGGRPVLIERPEFGLAPTVTKDGVTVFKALGFPSAVRQLFLESARDCASRTAQEAGDGTTTSTILFEALTRLTLEFCRSNKAWSPQRVVSLIQRAFAEVLEPAIEKAAIRSDLSTPEGRRRLRAVAEVSANGDSELADAVLSCYEICGDDGNVTIVDATGKRSYLVEKIDGFPISMGYEHSCGRYAPIFVNRTETQQAVLDKPIFLLNFGRISDIQSVAPILVKLQDALSAGYLKTPNVVLVATAFGEQVLTSLAQNWSNSTSLNIFPLLTPNDSPVHNAQRQFMDDLAAVTNAVVFDPMTHPIDQALFEEIGNLKQNFDTENWEPGNVRQVEIGRYRTTILGFSDEEVLLSRAEIVKAQLEQAASELESVLTKERLAKLTGGIAKLTVRGASNGEVKERRDRAEDAICAVRGAIKDGCLPGGAWMLLKLYHALCQFDEKVYQQILMPALTRPFHVLLDNLGLNEDEQTPIRKSVMESAKNDSSEDATVYNALTGKMVKAVDTGLLDSLPAVRDALKNAISISTLLGTCGGIIVQPRDGEIERKEAHNVADFNRMSSVDVHDRNS